MTRFGTADVGIEILEAERQLIPLEQRAELCAGEHHAPHCRPPELALLQSLGEET